MSNDQTPAAVIQQAAVDIAAAAAAITDPAERAWRLEDAARVAVPALQRAIRVERARAIREALETRSAVRVAEEFGMSRARLYKLLEERGEDA